MYAKRGFWGRSAGEQQPRVRDEWYKKASWEVAVPLNNPKFLHTTDDRNLNNFLFNISISTGEASLPQVVLRCKCANGKGTRSVKVFWKIRMLHPSDSESSLSYCCEKKASTGDSYCSETFDSKTTQIVLCRPPGCYSVLDPDWKEEGKACLLVVSISLLEPLTRASHSFPSMTFSKPWNQSDVVFVVQGKKIHAHRQVLSLHSPVFTTMLYGNFKERDSPNIKLPEKKYAHLKELFLLLYPQFANWNLDFQKALRLVGLFHEYQIAQLEDQARQVMFDGINSEKAFECYAVANRFGYEELKHKAVRTLSEMSTDDLLDRQPFVQADDELRTLIREARVLYLENNSISR